MKKRISTFLTMFLLVFLLGLNVCAASPVAQIGSKKYSSLEKAFSAVKKGQTITLKKNTTINGDLKIKLGKKSATLNLNKKKLTVKGTLNLASGTLTVSGNGNLTAKQVKNAGSLTLKNGTINGSVYNTGKFTMDGGKLNYSKDLMYAIWAKSGTVTINKGTVTYKRHFVSYEDGNETPETTNGATIIALGKSKVIVNGGKIVSTSETIMTDGDCKVNVILNGGTFQSANGGCIAHMGGTITINGGNYSIKGVWGFAYVYGNCTLNIKGGNIKSQWSLVETYSERSKANISGGTMTTTMPGNDGQAAMFIAYNGKINITGGKFVAKNKPYAYWRDPNSTGSIKVSKKVKMPTPNLWKKTDDVCA